MNMKQPISNNKQTVIVAMSGGVDSSVAAFLLMQQGYRVIGATIDTGCGDAPERAAEVCAALSIPHRVIDGRADFRARIVDAFRAAYAACRTPNPCVDCNAEIKFPLLLPLLEEYQAQNLATGHYARIAKRGGRSLIRRGVDPAKDQSYFLYRLPPTVVERCLFPLGEYNKAQVRAIAAQYRLPSAAARDSFDICFVPQNDYRSLLTGIGAPGEIVDQSGRVVGRHRGLTNYTIGQRHGVEVALPEPSYVLALDREHNRLVIGPKNALDCREAVVEQLRLAEPPAAAFPAQVCIRYKARPADAVLYPEADGRLRIVFAEPVWGVTPGQSAVFYDDDVVLGGGKFCAAP